MRNPSPYLRLRVIGAIETAPGGTICERMRHVAQMTFMDEDRRELAAWSRRFSSIKTPIVKPKTALLPYAFSKLRLSSNFLLRYQLEKI